MYGESNAAVENMERRAKAEAKDEIFRLIIVCIKRVVSEKDNEKLSVFGFKIIGRMPGGLRKWKCS